MSTAASELAPWELLRDCLDRSDRAGAELVLSSLQPEETVRVLFRLSSDDQQRLLALIPPENAAELLYEFPDKHAADLIDNLEADQAAHIVDELPSDEGADILGSLDREIAEAILDEMDPEAAGDVRELIDYPADAAGADERVDERERVVVRHGLGRRMGWRARAQEEQAGQAHQQPRASKERTRLVARCARGVTDRACGA